jgi:hypothetical protein
MAAVAELSTQQYGLKGVCPREMKLRGLPLPRIEKRIGELNHRPPLPRRLQDITPLARTVTIQVRMRLENPQNNNHYLDINSFGERERLASRMARRFSGGPN